MKCSGCGHTNIDAARSCAACWCCCRCGIRKGCDCFVPLDRDPRDRYAPDDATFPPDGGLMGGRFFTLRGGGR